MKSELSIREFAKTTNPAVTAHLRSGLASGQRAEAFVSRPRDRRIQVVVMLLERNVHKQVAIEDMASLVNLSPSRLAHLFKSEMELSIQQYLTRLRLAKAKNQLETGFLSIKEIAASVGFSSVTRFVACFKNFAGATPSQYRKHFPHASYRSAKGLV
jgi:AraC family transcriptional regulator, arabinose operon regulatory protein